MVDTMRMSFQVRKSCCKPSVPCLLLLENRYNRAHTVLPKFDVCEICHHIKPFSVGQHCLIVNRSADEIGLN